MKIFIWKYIKQYTIKQWNSTKNSIVYTFPLTPKFIFKCLLQRNRGPISECFCLEPIHCPARVLTHTRVSAVSLLLQWRSFTHGHPANLLESFRPRILSHHARALLPVACPLPDWSTLACSNPNPTCYSAFTRATTIALSLATPAIPLECFCWQTPIREVLFKATQQPQQSASAGNLQQSTVASRLGAPHPPTPPVQQMLDLKGTENKAVFPVPVPQS